jgi:hypothetical protein
MKILITSCCDSLMWYHNLLGTTHTVIRVDKSYYWCREPSGYLNIVHLQDAEIINN